MSDIRFEGWLHRSGTGGVYQDSAGNVGIASTQPQTRLDIGNGGFQVGPTGIATVTTVNTTNLINATPLSHRNIIINGDMRVAQRATSAAVSNGSNEGYATLDRWRHGLNNAAVATVSQSTTVPTGEGFANSMKIDVTTADTSVASNDFWIMNTKLEGQDLQRIKKGTSNAEKLTLSFWVRSGKTGTYICELEDSDNSRSVSLAYTISLSLIHI